MKSAICLLIFASVVFGCKFPEVKSPKFNRDSAAVIEDLKKLGKFENANIKSATRSFNDKTTSSLTIELINGEDLPAQGGLESLGKEAVKIVMTSIENVKDYESFRVEFVSKQSAGIASASSSTVFDFDPADLN
jgi:hypothetical protein